MAHSVQTMAYKGEVPWHGLGNRLEPNQPIPVWVKQAGMDWKIEETDVLYNVSGKEELQLRHYSDNKVLYRSDSHAPLSVVSKRYQVVQPREVLEFYRDLVKAGSFELETAGVLKGGRKLWALAKTGQQVVLRGGDEVKGYLLLATSCDGTMATTAQFTSIRVVCNNTLQIATQSSVGAIKVPHSTNFDPLEVKRELGLGMTAWDEFIQSIKVLSERKVNKFETMSFLIEVLGDPGLPLDQQPNQKGLQGVYNLFAGAGKGSDLVSSYSTAWGLVNGVTEYIDHQRRAMSPDHRLDSAWFGGGAQIKARAFMEAMKLVT